jgi:signal transduction histidine kinase
MRLSRKTSLAVLAVYLLLLGVVAFAMDHRLRAVSENALRYNAQLIGREIAALLTGPALEQLLQLDPAAHAKLIETVNNVTDRSQVVTSLVVVNSDGVVVAGDADQLGQHVSLPQIVFEGETRPRFVAGEDFLVQGASYLFVPLTLAGQPIGYLRLSLRSDNIAQMYRAAWRELLFVGIIGLVGIVGLGILLQLQFARVGTSLAQALDGVLRGEAVRGGQRPDEFAEAFETARRVSQELRAVRERSSQAQRRFDSLLQVMDVGVLLLNPNKGLDFANPRAQRLLGCADADALQRRWDELRPRLEDRLASCARAGPNGTQLDMDVPTAAGTNRLRIEFYQLTEDECQGHLLLVKNRDTVDVLENELRLAVQMRSVARFYMAFAHDLKAPLNAMVMNIELLRRTLGDAHNGDPQASDQQQRYIDVLKDEIVRLDRDLQMLLSEAALPSASAEVFDLRELVHTLEALLSPQAKQQHVTLATHVPEASVLFSGHRDRLKQALLNVTINAIEAMPTGGQLSVELRAADSMAQLVVADTGPGIPPEMLEEIYKMHFTTKEGGTGVGLYVARSVVEAHGGTIRVESAPGRGTRFEIVLPTAAGAHETV